MLTAKENMAEMSHPVWVRGLKLAKYADESERARVAPRVGAWIETRLEPTSIKVTSSRTPCGCVD